MPAESPATAHLTPVCPECGYRHDGPPGSPTPAMLRARARIPRWLLAIAALGVLSAMAVTARFSTLTSGPTVPMFVDPILSYADLQAIARGEPTPGPPLLARMQRALGSTTRIEPGRRFIEMIWTVQLGPPGPRIERRAVGWPAPWIDIRRFYHYADPLSRSGFKPAFTDPALKVLPLTRFAAPFFNPFGRVPGYPRFAWFGDMVRYQPPPESTGGIPLLASLNFVNIASTLGVLIVTWWLARAPIAVGRRILRRAPPTSRRARFVPVAITLAALAAIIVHARMGSGIELQPVSYRGAGIGGTPIFTRLSLDADQLAALHGPGGDRELAAAIIDQIPPSALEPRDHAILVLMWKPEYVRASGDVVSFRLGSLFPVASFNSGTYELNVDTTNPGPFHRRPGLSFQSSPGARWLLIYSPGRPDRPEYNLVLDGPRCAALIAGFWLVWFIPRTVITLIQRTQLRRRARRGLCLQCRYPLPGVSS